MKKEKIIDIIFAIIGIIGFLELSFIRGLFTGPIVMVVCGITGIISVIYSIVKKNYHSAILYALLFATIFFGYWNIITSTSNSELNLDTGEIENSTFEPDLYFEMGSYYYELQADEETIYFVGYTFNDDGTVIGMIGGESGVLEGKYYILNDKTIKCTFTTYSNDSVAILNQKLDKEGEITLNMVDAYTLECKEWSQKPMLDGEDLSFGENQTFNQFKVE